MTQKVIAIDTEFERKKTYKPILSIIQLKEEGKEAVVYDVYTQKEDLKYLISLLSDDSVVKIIHSARQDVEAIYYHFNIVMKNIFDTQIAVNCLTGENEIGYAKLVKQYCGKNIMKEKKLQNSHWLQRPLSDEQIFYAKQDVEHLHEAYYALNNLLMEKKNKVIKKRSADVAIDDAGNNGISHHIHENSGADNGIADSNKEKKSNKIRGNKIKNAINNDKKSNNKKNNNVDYSDTENNAIQDGIINNNISENSEDNNDMYKQFKEKCSLLEDKRMYAFNPRHAWHKICAKYKKNKKCSIIRNMFILREKIAFSIDVPREFVISTHNLVSFAETGDVKFLKTNYKVNKNEFLKLLNNNINKKKVCKSLM